MFSETEQMKSADQNPSQVRGVVPIGAFRVVMSVITSESGWSRDMVLGHLRLHDLVRSRWLAIWILFETTKCSASNIATRFGGRHHTTVLHALSSVKSLRDTDGVFRERGDRLLALVKQRLATEMEGNFAA